jgi:mRNA interferase MazF
MVPDRGDIIYINFNPTRGHEQRGKRPALVISPAAFNSRTNTIWACPITTKQRGWAFETSLDGLGTETSGAIRADQVKTMDFNARGFTFKEKAPSDVTADVLAKIRAVLA